VETQNGRASGYSGSTNVGRGSRVISSAVEWNEVLLLIAGGHRQPKDGGTDEARRLFFSVVECELSRRVSFLRRAKCPRLSERRRAKRAGPLDVAKGM